MVTLMVIASWHLVEVEAREVACSSSNGGCAGGRPSVEPDRGQIGIPCSVDSDCPPVPCPGGNPPKCVQGMCKC
ncbi:hypothetical protein AB3S75_007721 [Citrus x aurantiifolia]